MISEETIQCAAEQLLKATPAGTRVILFGSQARGFPSDQSDVDFLVIEPEVHNHREEMVRLRQLLRPLRIPVDIIVVSGTVFEEWKNSPYTILYEALKEGKEFGIAA